MTFLLTFSRTLVWSGLFVYVRYRGETNIANILSLESSRSYTSCAKLPDQSHFGQIWNESFRRIALRVLKLVIILSRFWWWLAVIDRETVFRPLAPYQCNPRHFVTRVCNISCPARKKRASLYAETVLVLNVPNLRIMFTKNVLVQLSKQSYLF